MTNGQFRERMRFLKHLSFFALGGLVAVVLALVFATGAAKATVGMVGALATVPAVVYMVLLTVWHWKSRYRGTHSDLWGGILLLETSGWFKIVYLFRHLLPDYWATGRYRPPATR